MHARELIAEILRTNISIPPVIISLLALVEGWDLLKGVLGLVLRLEEIVGRELSEEDIAKLQSVEDVDLLLKTA